jgi:hypothetical protein
LFRNSTVKHMHLQAGLMRVLSTLPKIICPSGPLSPEPSVQSTLHNCSLGSLDRPTPEESLQRANQVLFRTGHVCAQCACMQCGVWWVCGVHVYASACTCVRALFICVEYASGAHACVVFHCVFTCGYVKMCM